MSGLRAVTLWAWTRFSRPNISIFWKWEPWGWFEGSHQCTAAASWTEKKSELWGWKFKHGSGHKGHWSHIVNFKLYLQVSEKPSGNFEQEGNLIWFIILWDYLRWCLENGLKFNKMGGRLLHILSKNNERLKQPNSIADKVAWTDNHCVQQ